MGLGGWRVGWFVGWLGTCSPAWEGRLNLKPSVTPITGPGRPTREPVCEMAPKKSATVIKQELRELRAWVLAHQGALAARDSDRPGLQGRLRNHWSQEEQRWYWWVQKHDSRFEGDCSHLASQRRALDDMAA